MTIRPVDAEDVPAIWPSIANLVWQSVRSSRGNQVTVQRILANLTSARWVLWVGCTPKIEGFGVTEVIEDDKGFWVNIPFAAGKIDLIKPFFDEIVRVASEAGAHSVRFCSYRRGFDRLAQKFGWKEMLKQYEIARLEGE